MLVEQRAGQKVCLPAFLPRLHTAFCAAATTSAAAFLTDARWLHKATARKEVDQEVQQFQ